MTGLRAVGTVLAALLAAGCSAGGGEGHGGPVPTPGIDRSTGSRAPEREPPLAGKVVVIDPGHQLGNRRFGSRIDAPVDAGGFEKACNTTGTSTDDGYPEATFAWEVSVEARRMLRRLGARVVLTRAANRDDLWGPCVDERGRAGNPGQAGPTADLKLSVHADGLHGEGAAGFHVIHPEVLPGYTDDIAAPSRLLAVAVRDALVDAGFAPSSYRGRSGLDARRDLGTLNLSDVPAVMAELGNMRDPREAAVMRTADGRERYARALARGIRAYLTR